MSLRVRLLGAFAYVLVLALVALEVPLVLNVSRRVDAEVRAQAAGEAHLIAASAADRLGDGYGDRADLQQLVARAANDSEGRVILVDVNGVLLADSAGEGLVGSSYAGRPEIAEVLASGRLSQGARHSTTLGEDVLYTAVPIVDEDRRVGAVRVTQSIDAVNAKVRRDVLALAGIGAAALVLGLALAWILAGSLSRPLRGLARVADQVASGDLDARAEVAGSKEHRQLAIAFNEMTRRLVSVLAAQREFVANASHQLRTPLTGLRLRVEAAGLKSTEPEVQRELAAAERETERLTRLLTGLLALAREGEQPPLRKPVSLADAAELARGRWEAAAADADHPIVLDGDGDVRALASDEDAAIILDNLIENALLYSPRGAAISLEWGSRGGVAYLAVLDEGPGLELGEEGRIFERFARGKAGRDVPGTGLGLAIVRTLARRWEGEAQIGNRPGSGARAEVTLPLAGDGETGLPSPNSALEKPLLNRG